MSVSRQYTLTATRRNLFDATVEGYCLVFKRKTKNYELRVNREFNPPKLELEGDESVLLNALDPKDMLKGLQRDKYDEPKRYPIEYTIIDPAQALLEGGDKVDEVFEVSQEFIYVIISCKEDIIEKWAEERDIDVPIDPRQTIILSKKHCKGNNNVYKLIHYLHHRTVVLVEINSFSLLCSLYKHNRFLIGRTDVFKTN